MTRATRAHPERPKAPPPSNTRHSPAITRETPKPIRPVESRTENAGYNTGRPDEGENDTTSVHEKKEQSLRYCDYYCFMSLKDFMAWAKRNDGSEPPISYSATSFGTEPAI